MELYGKIISKKHLKKPEVDTILKDEILFLSTASIDNDNDKQSSGIQLRIKTSKISTSEGIILCVLTKENPCCSLKMQFSSNDSPIQIWTTGNNQETNIHLSGMRVKCKETSTTNQRIQDLQSDYSNTINNLDIGESNNVVVQKLNNDVTIGNDNINSITEKVVRNKKRSTKDVALPNPEVDICTTSISNNVDNNMIIDNKDIIENVTISNKKSKKSKNENQLTLPNDVNMSKPWKVTIENNEGIHAKTLKTIYKTLKLSYIEYVIGNGIIPKPGSIIKIVYIAMFPDGKVFDAHIKRTQPFVFRKGINQVVKGLDIGIETMRIGGSREINIPPILGYGIEGYGIIPANQTLIFRVTLIA